MGLSGAHIGTMYPSYTQNEALSLNQHDIIISNPSEKQANETDKPNYTKSSINSRHKTTINTSVKCHRQPAPVYSMVEFSHQYLSMIH